MNFRINRLDILCRRDQIEIPFARFSYFYGEIGAGKSTIARLVDYCLGGDLTMTPALQSEFVSATITLDLSTTRLTLSRERGSNRVLATWETNDGVEQLLVPSRVPSGVLLEGTKVEVLSDLIFHLSGYIPPKVRRGALKEDSELQRLSLRDLLWYCYLDQDQIDSSFFFLGKGEDNFKRIKSRNVLRFVVGLHQEKVAELELLLEETRRERMTTEAAAVALKTTLLEVGISDADEIFSRQEELLKTIEKLGTAISEYRIESKPDDSHAIESLREEGRQLSDELDAIELTRREISETMSMDRQHLNEILALSTKVNRISGARAVLNGVGFVRCPRCAQNLPARSAEDCDVCGQPEPGFEDSEVESERVRADIDARAVEIRDVLDRQSDQLIAMSAREALLFEYKGDLDARLEEAMRVYDSKYLSLALKAEQDIASARQELLYLRRIETLPNKVKTLMERSEALEAEESALRKELRLAQAASEQDLRNVDRLKELFIDCLIRSQISGFSPNDLVRLSPPDFLPEVENPGSGDIAVTSFATLGSGGKKTLFKCCFALAMHRLAEEVGSILPKILIIDSPMKNISERENRRQFLGFHKLLYQLAENELRDTQFILLDKEFHGPESELLKVYSRHMRVHSLEEPPLIPYYRERDDSTFNIPVEDLDSFGGQDH